MVQSLRKVCGVTSSAFSRFCVWHHFKRTMATDSSRPDHLTRTANNTRSTTESLAVVKCITNLSPTVKGLKLQVADKSLRFLAGQWVDFAIPGLETVGGYSMCSAPYTLEQNQELELAVKYSKHPPAHWVHTQCKAGSKVSVRVGGDFFYAPSPGEKQHSLLLVAGGVGVNPIYSILRHAAHLSAGTKVSVLYSAQTVDELIFKDEIQKIAEENKNIKCKFFITRERDTGGKTPTKYGRIDISDVQQEVQDLQQNNTPVTSYICGPGPMIDTVETHLKQLGLDQQRIVYEKWW